ncbi:hypothetical protein [Haploplasma axanthum]|uniref:Uncharacterized protein n=1 Tax=Haploplasma axanthum TaxID=29552 RepID=A0A449BBJ1_HAPAX|nr:hypothetical protein [Haploplasma axanthum]VEU79824.1 Uncharacterised protein [Haploplasma axanthum]
MKKKRIIYLFLTAITCMTIFVGNKLINAIEVNGEKTTHLIKNGKTDNLYLKKLKTKIMKNASSKEELNNVYNEAKRYKKKNHGTIIINLNTKLNGYYTEKNMLQHSYYHLIQLIK